VRYMPSILPEGALECSGIQRQERQSGGVRSPRGHSCQARRAGMVLPRSSPPTRPSGASGGDRGPAPASPRSGMAPWVGGPYRLRSSRQRIFARRLILGRRGDVVLR